MSNCSRNVATCSFTQWFQESNCIFQIQAAALKCHTDDRFSRAAHKTVKMSHSSLTILFIVPSACMPRVSEISSRLFVMPTRKSNILSYFRRSASAALARADHGVWLRYFTVGVSSDWDKIIQRCVESLKNASSLCYEEDRKNVVASGNNHSMEWSVPQNNHARTMPEHPHIIFLPYCWRRRVSVHSISW